MIEKWVFLNGTFCLEKEASIPVTDRGFLFGDGMFTTIRVHQGKCEFLPSHVQRLQHQAEELKFDFNVSRWEWISEFIQRQRAWNGTWRLKIIVTIKEEQDTRKMGCLLATLDPYQGISFDPCRLCLFSHPVESPLAHIKSLSYLDHLHVRAFAQQRGFVDAITYTYEGFVLETGSSNLFWIDQGICWVPDPQLPYLKGVFLQNLLTYLALPVRVVKATIDQIPVSASVYICNALTHVRPVLSIDDCVFVRNMQQERRLQEATIQALEIS